MAVGEGTAGSAWQSCREMGLAWRREEGREVILVVGFRTLLDAFWKEPKKKRGHLQNVRESLV